MDAYEVKVNIDIFKYQEKVKLISQLQLRFFYSLMAYQSLLHSHKIIVNNFEVFASIKNVNPLRRKFREILRSPNCLRMGFRQYFKVVYQRGAKNLLS